MNLIRNPRVLMYLLMGLSMLAPSLAFADTWYVKSSGTKMNAEESSSSKVISVLSSGAAVNVQSKGKRFYKVSAGGKTGYIFKFKLTQTKPGGGGGGGLDSLVGGQKMAASESSSGSSIRGLSPISEDYAKDKGIKSENVAAVRQMEGFGVSRTAVDQFLKEGELGEYAQ